MFAQSAEVPPVFVLKSGFFLNTLTCGQLCPSPYTFLSRQSHFPHPSQKSFEQRKEITFDRRLANITAPVVRGLYCPPQNLIQKTLQDITANVKAGLILFLLLLVPEQRLNCTQNHLTSIHWRRTFYWGGNSSLLECPLSTGWLGVRSTATE